MYSPAKPEPMTTASTSRVAVDEAISRSPLCARNGSAGAPGRGPWVLDDGGPDRFDDVLVAAFASGQEEEREEAVRLTGVATEVDRDARFRQPFGVRLALVA